MSRVTYILGAGASFGERKRDANGKIIEFTRGLPIVNELERAIELLMRGGHSGTYFPAKEAEEQCLTLDQYNLTCQRLSLLKQACASYPTIDTLAKQLYVTQEPLQLSSTDSIDYETLKRLLSISLVILQSESKRDLRYDGFIAALIDRMRNFPPMTILSWNYDLQFELAYAGYAEKGKYIPYQWEELNVLNKMYPTPFNDSYNFAMVKLNGTAFFTDKDAEKWEVKGKLYDRIKDYFYGGSGLSPFQYAYNCLTNPHLNNLLSYSWEEQNRSTLEAIIKQRIQDTKELIVVGYSFPYVNNEIDSFILCNMNNLEKVVVQDLNFEDIKERIEGIMAPLGRTVQIVHKKSLQQFYIPNRFK